MKTVTTTGDPQMTYDHEKIANELYFTAMGHAYHGNALRVAKDFPFLTADDRSVLDRYATGKQIGIDFFRLQQIANNIRSKGGAE